MSAEQGSKTTQQSNAEGQQPASAEAPASEIQNLMQPGARPDLESEALRAAEAALAAGERALAQARQARGRTEPQGPTRSQLREKALRMVLVFNMLLLLVVLLLPDRATEAPVKPVDPLATPLHPQPGPRSGDLYDQALEAAANNDYAEASALLERWLAETPRMHPGQQLNAYHALAHYSFKLGNLAKNQEYVQKATTLVRSSTLPEDLVQMAQQAEQRSDHEAMRQLWARFLLQQRQVPASMYSHVAQAYLKLGDSYRSEAGKAAEAARVRDLEELRSRMDQETAAPAKVGR